MTKLLFVTSIANAPNNTDPHMSNEINIFNNFEDALTHLKRRYNDDIDFFDLIDKYPNADDMFPASIKANIINDHITLERTITTCIDNPNDYTKDYIFIRYSLNPFLLSNNFLN